jgi:tetratricopeptide (TPR) repeat protein
VAHHARRWPIVLLVIGDIVTAAIGVALGAATGIAAAASTASTLAAHGSYANAVAIDEEIASRTGPLYLLDPGAAGAARGAAAQTVMAWAAALGRKGEVDAAVALYRSVTAPPLRRAALDALAALLFTTATAEAARAQYPDAILRLREIGSLAPATPDGVRAAQQLPVDQVGEASLLVTAGRAADAAMILTTVLTEHSAQATTSAVSLFPSAWLAAGEEALAADSYLEARKDLEQLVTTFPASAEASQAETLLEAPQAVSGTLVTHTGAPVSGRVRLSSNYKAEPGGRYQTSAPFYYTTADASGDFNFSSVPIGGPYVLEVFSAGNWSTLINPSTNQPANPVKVTPILPVDLTIVVLPS